MGLTPVGVMPIYHPMSDTRTPYGIQIFRNARVPLGPVERVGEPASFADFFAKPSAPSAAEPVAPSEPEPVAPTIPLLPREEAIRNLTDAEADAMWLRLRWPDGTPRCPTCGSADLYDISYPHAPQRWKCNHDWSTFTPTSGGAAVNSFYDAWPGWDSRAGRGIARFALYNAALRPVRELCGWLSLRDYEAAKEAATNEIISHLTRGSTVVQDGCVIDEEDLKELSSIGDRAMERIRRRASLS